MKNNLLITAVLVVLAHSERCQAQGTLNVNATISDVQNGSVWDYTITLNNPAGSAAVGTFWFDWTPGNFYLSVNPTSVTPPTGWTIATQSGSIEFNTTTPLAAGSSAMFGFVSTETPSAVFANSSQPGDSSTVYTGSSAFSGSAEEFNVSAVPEPSSWALMWVGLAGAGVTMRASKFVRGDKC